MSLAVFGRSHRVGALKAVAKVCYIRKSAGERNISDIIFGGNKQLARPLKSQAVYKSHKRLSVFFLELSAEVRLIVAKKSAHGAYR